MNEASALGADLIAAQTEFAESVSYLREVGPGIIERMRDIALERAAADTFQLIVGTLDYAAPQSSVSVNELSRIHAMLTRDQQLDANMPTETRRLLAAASTVISTKRTIRSQLNQLRGTPAAASAGTLALAVNDAYGSAVAGADSSRMMLAVYAVVLFLAVGFVGFRLRSSYTEINRANDELAGLNESLEQRVHERTEELSTALSELKESQVQLVQAEKMSSLGQLVAGISHEINTPLLYLANNAALINERLDLLGTFVQRCSVAFALDRDACADRNEYQAKFIEQLLGLKKMLREDELEAATEDAQDLMKDSIEGLEDLTDMAQSLKDFSRLDRAPVGSFDVNAGIEKTLTIARNVVKEKAEVHKFFSDLPDVQCSPSKINQVFLNLITNAAQAIEKHGEIVIKTSQYGPDHVAVSISDTGCGISEENLSRIRDPFFTTKEVGTGTGLGLSIVEEIVRSHGGELQIQSKVGEGSTFTVILPVKQAAPATPVEAHDGDPVASDAPFPESQFEEADHDESKDDLAEAV